MNDGIHVWNNESKMVRGQTKKWTEKKTLWIFVYLICYSKIKVKKNSEWLRERNSFWVYLYLNTHLQSEDDE